MHFPSSRVDHSSLVWRSLAALAVRIRMSERHLLHMTTSIERLRNAVQRSRVIFNNEGEAPPVDGSVTDGAGY